MPREYKERLGSSDETTKYGQKQEGLPNSGDSNEVYPVTPVANLPV